MSRQGVPLEGEEGKGRWGTVQAGMRRMDARGTLLITILEFWSMLLNGRWMVRLWMLINEN